jgi:hypothetical protein
VSEGIRDELEPVSKELAYQSTLNELKIVVYRLAKVRFPPDPSVAGIIVGNSK